MSKSRFSVSAVAFKFLSNTQKIDIFTAYLLVNKFRLIKNNGESKIGNLRLKNVPNGPM